MRPKVRQGASRRQLSCRRWWLLPCRLPPTRPARPLAVQVQHRPWQRRAIQYAAYAFWPLLLLWIITSYPGSGSSRRHGPAGASTTAAGGQQGGWGGTRVVGRLASAPRFVL